VLLDLSGQLARGCQDQARVVPLAGRQTMKDRSAKAAVLPLPVMAVATSSRPSMAGGIVFCWIGVGLREAEIGDAAQQRRVELEGRERQ